MKKFMKEITLFIIQLLIFYLFPLFAKRECETFSVNNVLEGLLW